MSRRPLVGHGQMRSNGSCRLVGKEGRHTVPVEMVYPAEKKKPGLGIKWVRGKKTSFWI